MDIFRRPEDIPPIVDEAIALGAKVVWMQLGISEPESAARARDGRPRGGGGPLHQDGALPLLRRAQRGRACPPGWSARGGWTGSRRDASRRDYGFDTRALHAGQRVDPVTGSRAVPIHQTAAYVFEDADHAADLFDLNRFGNIYTRIMNPTTAVFEERMASLEGGVGALATASGLAAQSVAITTLLEAGDHIVASRHLYGGSHNQLAITLARFGIETTFVDPADLARLARGASTPRTRLMYGETIGNPRLDVLDIAAVAEVADEAGVPLLIDNTFATPYLCRPIEHGAHLVSHSATKWICGHGTTIGGVLIDARHLPLGRRPLPRPGRAERRLPRPALRRDLRELRLHHEGARRDDARPGAGALARSTPSCCCRAWRPCRCGWTATWTTPSRSPSSCAATRAWSG